MGIAVVDNRSFFEALRKSACHESSSHRCYCLHVYCACVVAYMTMPYCSSRTRAFIINVFPLIAACVMRHQVQNRETPVVIQFTIWRGAALAGRYLELRECGRHQCGKEPLAATQVHHVPGILQVAAFSWLKTVAVSSWSVRPAVRVNHLGVRRTSYLTYIPLVPLRVGACAIPLFIGGGVAKCLLPCTYAPQRPHRT